MLRSTRSFLSCSIFVLHTLQASRTEDVRPSITLYSIVTENDVNSSFHRHLSQSQKNSVQETARLLTKFAKLTTKYAPSEKDDSYSTISWVLALEVFTIASGNHFILPPSTDASIEKMRRDRSGAVVSTFWAALPFTTFADLGWIFKDSIDPYARTLLNVNTTAEILQNALNKLFDLYCNNATEYNTLWSLPFSNVPSTTEGKVYIPFEDLTKNESTRSKIYEWFEASSRFAGKLKIHSEFLKIVEGAVEDLARFSVVEHSLLKCIKKQLHDDEDMRGVYLRVLDDEVRMRDTFSLQSFIRGLTKNVETNARLNTLWLEELKAEVEDESLLEKEKENQGRRTEVDCGNFRREYLFPCLLGFLLGLCAPLIFASLSMKFKGLTRRNDTTRLLFHLNHV
jgi:hypothetical protein